MGKIKDLTIQLERNKPYFAGEFVVGEVTFNLTSCLAIRHILLSFEGFKIFSFVFMNQGCNSFVGGNLFEK